MLKGEKSTVAVLVRRFLETGGAERYAVEVTRRLKERYQITVFCEEFDESLTDGIKIERIANTSKSSRSLAYRNFSNLTEKLTSEFDVIHSHERITHGDIVTLHCLCFRSFRLMEKRNWKAWRERVNELMAPRYRIYGKMERAQFLGSANRRFIVPATYVQENVQKLYSVPSERFSLAAPGVDPSFFEERKESQKLRESWGFDLQEKVFLFAGSEFKRKGLDVALKALSLTGGINLVVVGGGNPKPYEALVRQLGLISKVKFLGLCPNMAEIYRSVDAFILPTRVEPFGMAPLEAMASGLPLIISGPNHCGLSTELTGEEAILLSDPADPHELKEAMCKLMEHELIREMGSAGAKKAREFTWENTAAETAEIYESVLESKS